MKQKQIVTFIVMLATTSAVAQITGTQELNFTIDAQVPVTPIKNQHRSGTCWDYATLGFFESEILRQTGKTYDLSEMFVASKDYVDCATYHVRMHGNSRFSEGGSADDVLHVIRTHGICPETAMAAPGSLVGDSLANFKEFFTLLDPYVTSLAKGSQKELTSQWLVGLQGILDAYLGPCPQQFEYEGKTYTPQSFAASLGINWDDYVSITSFTHHPFYQPFVIEAPYKWRPRLSQNVPLETLLAIIDHAIAEGYTVAWGGDVSESGFTRNGLAIVDDESQLPPTQELRQQRFDNWNSTYDHVMLIYGTAHDQFGNAYYLVKNSWGVTGKYKGAWYMSKDYIALNTTYIFLNRNAIDKTIRKQLTVTLF